MSVIISRALPDVRDGLKPVHRRVLYAMYDMGNTLGQALQKIGSSRRRCHRQVSSPWRCRGLRYHRPVSARFLDALSADRWPGKLRLHRSRSSRGHALHRNPHGPPRRRAVSGYRERDRRFHSELRRLPQRTGGSAVARSKFAGQRRLGYRGRNGDQYPAAQSGGSDRWTGCPGGKSRTSRSNN